MPPSSPLTRALLGATLMGVIGLTATHAAEPGEPFLLRGPAEAPAVRAASLSPFQPVGVTSRLRRATLQFEALVADEAWDEAIDLLTHLETEAGDELVPSADDPSLETLVADPEGHRRYTPLAERLQLMLASLPTEGLEAYRDRVGRSAQERANEGVLNLDVPALAKVVREAYASPATGEASLALAELALERGDTAAARRWLTPLDRLARGPYGRPAGVSLATIDPRIAPSDLAAAWSETPRPDTPLAGAEDGLTATVLARLAYASLREGDLRRAAAEARLLRGVAPDATGRFAGREQPLADALDALIAAPGEVNPTPRVRPDYGWAWSRAVPFEPQPPRPVGRFAGVRFGVNVFGQRQVIRSPIARPEAGTPRPSLLAAATESSAFYVEQGRLKRIDLPTGAVDPVSLPGFETPQAPSSPGPALDDLTRRLALEGGQAQLVQFAKSRNAPTPAGSSTRIDPQLATAGGLLFVRVVEGPKAGRAVRGAQRTIRETLIGIDPATPEVAAVQLVLTRDAVRGAINWQFAGPPTVRGDRLYVPLARSGVRSNVAVACYSMRTSRELWRTELGAGEPSLRGSQANLASITVAGDTVYMATELGALAALDATSGTQRWLALYPRGAGRLTGIDTATPPRRCFVVGDRVLAAPSDCARLFAWDTATGRPLWDAPRSQEDRLVGVVDDPDGSIAVLAGRRLAGFDSLTGRQQFQWPESERAGLRGRGVAAIVDGEVFWPTRNELIAFDPVRRGLSRSPIGLHPVGASGANLLATDLGLLVAGPKKIRLLATRGPIPTEPGPPSPRLSHGAVSPPATLAAQP
ncbi:outer membrane biogenesis protein BamB [Planctomycetes bacterium MalM25]|nr:outer membrane biogenesis protein BamB [Planctomycetes bacterium MalM25]